VGCLPPLLWCGRRLVQPSLPSGALGERQHVPLLSLWRSEKARHLLSWWVPCGSKWLTQEAPPSPIPSRRATHEALPQVCILAEAQEVPLRASSKWRRRRCCRGFSGQRCRGGGEGAPPGDGH
jgi:hypothetical protein